MAGTSFKIDYAAAERDARSLRRQVDELLLTVQKVEDHAITYLHGDGTVLWEDRLATTHYELVAGCVKDLRKMANHLDEVADGITQTVEAYRAAEAKTS